MILSKTVGVPN